MEFSKWRSELEESFARGKLIQGKGIVLSDTGGGIRIENHIAEMPLPQKSGFVYSGPFKVAKIGDNSVKILGCNYSEKRFIRNYLTLGIDQIEFPETEVAEIAVTTWLSLKINNIEGEYSLEPYCSATFPEQSASDYYVPLAFIMVDESGIISDIHQCQFGQIEGAGRIF